MNDVLIRSHYGAVPLPDAQIEEIVTDGVRASLRLYSPAPAP
ncbi:hypothetical protein [Streptomyces huiliensis]|nr:hypothetical protein [Streptomyces huiliensis]